jgi:23S rRNA G2069 N7-methylase RlmK/C1962 C5-methylase RlmI
VCADELLRGAHRRISELEKDLKAYQDYLLVQPMEPIMDPSLHNAEQELKECMDDYEQLTRQKQDLEKELFALESQEEE